MKVKPKYTTATDKLGCKLRFLKFNGAVPKFDNFSDEQIETK